ELADRVVGLPEAGQAVGKPLMGCCVIRPQRKGGTKVPSRLLIPGNRGQHEAHLAMDPEVPGLAATRLGQQIGTRFLGTARVQQQGEQRQLVPCRRGRTGERGGGEFLELIAFPQTDESRNRSRQGDPGSASRAIIKNRSTRGLSLSMNAT